MKTTIHWGIVGLGKIARTFAEDLQRNPHAIIYAVASRDGNKAKAFANEFGATHYVDSYAELAHFSELDVVYIATPHSLHAELAIFFLERNIPVLCEKPLAINYHQVALMVDAARKNNTFLMEAIWTRFFPTFQKALSIIASGALGTITTVRADFGFHSSRSAESRIFNRALGGGAILDVGIYPVFLALSTLGIPTDVVAKSVFTATNVDATTVIRLDYENGNVADLFCSVVNETDVVGEVYGTKGRLKLHSRFHHSSTLTWNVYGEPEQLYEVKCPDNGYGYEIEEVHYCLSENKKESDLLPLDFSLTLITLLDQIREKAGVVYPVDQKEVK